MKKSIFITAVLSAFISMNSCKQNPSAATDKTADAEKIATDGSSEEQNWLLRLMYLLL